MVGFDPGLESVRPQSGTRVGNGVGWKDRGGKTEPVERSEEEEKGWRPNVLERRRSSSPVGETDASGGRDPPHQRTYEDKVVAHPRDSTVHPVGSSDPGRTGWRRRCWNTKHIVHNPYKPNSIRCLPGTKTGQANMLKQKANHEVCKYT